MLAPAMPTSDGDNKSRNKKYYGSYISWHIPFTYQKPLGKPKHDHVVLADYCHSWSDLCGPHVVAGRHGHRSVAGASKKNRRSTRTKTTRCDESSSWFGRNGDTLPGFGTAGLKEEMREEDWERCDGGFISRTQRAAAHWMHSWIATFSGVGSGKQCYQSSTGTGLRRLWNVLEES